jgi:beta-glucanase (GH16 family)
MRTLTTVVAASFLMLTPAASTPQRASRQWKLSWSDEFNGPDGSAPDVSKWEIVTGGSGFGNKELEQYTTRPVNVHQEHGNLVITARHETFTGADGIQREYTSARLQTKGKFEQKYGRFEARIKIPKGQGMWPAFWLLGNDNSTTGWPACGEIDIMENVGYEPGKIHGSMHGPRYSGDSPLTGGYSVPAGSAFADNFHVFAVEWNASAVRFYVDNHLYETQTPDSIPSSKRWVFDHPFFILLNLAVGGNWPKDPDPTTQFPQQMLVDYVRVYTHT